jgi:uncharacterized protein YecT (DUF1311 family)
MKLPSNNGREAELVNSTVRAISMKTLGRCVTTIRERVLGVALLGAVCFTISGLPVHAFAQAKQETLPCTSETTTAGMRSCENQRYEQAQKALDAAYAELMTQLDSTGKAKLRAAQSAWLQFRQADADFEASRAAGGTLAPLIRITVMADLTEARAVELKKSLQP